VEARVIIILKRDDLPSEHRDRPMESLELDQAGLSSELVEQAELIVFVEGIEVKFLKQLKDLESRNSMDVLTHYIISTTPTVKHSLPWSLKRFGQRRQRK
jgi:hypothetical protein